MKKNTGKNEHGDEGNRESDNDDNTTHDGRHLEEDDEVNDDNTTHDGRHLEENDKVIIEEESMNEEYSEEEEDKRNEHEGEGNRESDNDDNITHDDRHLDEDDEVVIEEESMNEEYSEEEHRRNEHEGEGNRESDNDNTTHEPLLSLEDWIKKQCASQPQADYWYKSLELDLLILEVGITVWSDSNSPSFYHLHKILALKHYMF